MICPRCGTEHENEEGICPRCGYGRPKEKKPVPKWIPWLGGSLGVLLVIGTVVGVIVATHFDSSWMSGSWEGSNLAITFNTTDKTFLLSNGDNVVSGSFTANRDAFTLTAEDGNLYVYRYSRINPQKMKLMFNRGNETVKVTVNRVSGPEEEETEGDSLEDIE